MDEPISAIDKWNYASERLKDEIFEKGRIILGGILDVSLVVNHVVDVKILRSCADAVYIAYESKYSHPIDYIVTVESSGIALSTLLADRFDCKMIFAKKIEPITFNGKETYTASVESFTKKRTYEVVVLKELLNHHTRLMVADDFIATGTASRALLKIIEESGAELAGIVALITKDIPGQEGWKYLTEFVERYNHNRRSEGTDLASLNTLIRIDKWPEDAREPSDLGYAKTYFEIL